MSFERELGPAFYFPLWWDEPWYFAGREAEAEQREVLELAGASTVWAHRVDRSPPASLQEPVVRLEAAIRNRVPGPRSQAATWARDYLARLERLGALDEADRLDPALDPRLQPRPAPAPAAELPQPGSWPRAFEVEKPIAQRLPVGPEAVPWVCGFPLGFYDIVSWPGGPIAVAFVGLDLAVVYFRDGALLVRADPAWPIGERGPFAAARAFTWTQR